MKKTKVYLVAAGLLTICIFASCRMMAPIGLTELGNTGELFEPEITYEGEPLEVDVVEDELKLSINGHGNIQKINKNCLRLKSETGHLTIGLKKNEAIYGLTERTVSDKTQSESYPAEVGGLDRRGELVRMWVVPTISAYAPFYISSRGYGMFVEGTWPGIYDIGKTDPDVLRTGWLTGDEGFSCVFIFGDSYTEILNHYTEMTGRPVLPPKWVFLPLKWRDKVGKNKFAELDGVTMNAEVVDDILGYEKHGFPIGMYMIDRPWAEGTMGYGNFDWDPKRLPNGDEMVEVTNAAGG
jgi:alpha-glucosidase (family GH31 glycosyl hydrolase)